MFVSLINKCDVSYKNKMLSSHVCINCGAKISQLYKEYSPTVLKLTKCEQCGQTADKYVEIDLGIIVIDLVLLKTEAYRHILCNTEFKFHWKLAIILHTIEAYYEWMLKTPDLEYQPNHFDVNEFTVDDLMFYNICFLVFIKTSTFILLIYFLTLLRNKKYDIKKSYKNLFLETWKCVTLSSFGLFLLVPSFIWGGKSTLDNSMTFVTFFTTLSQLFAYRATNNYSREWSIFVILTSNIFSILSHFSINYLLNKHLNLGYVSSLGYLM
nr:protein ARV1 [Onthophagus taurus]